MDDGVHPSSGGHACPVDEPLRPGVRDAACRQHGVSTRRQALTEYTPDEVRARVAAGRWRGVLRGTYARRTVPLDDGTVPAAARLVVGRTWSGARARLPRCTGSAWCATTRSTPSGPRAAVCAACAVPACTSGPPTPATWWGSTACRSPRPPVPRRTSPGCSRGSTASRCWTPPLGTGATDRYAVEEVLARSRRLAGVPRARALLRHADPGAESPTESRLRPRVLDAGLPPPACQYPVSGGRYRLDLAWPESRVAAEYDGAVHDGRAASRADRARHNALRAAGWRVFVCTDVDVYREPERIGALLAQALALPVAS